MIEFRNQLWIQNPRKYTAEARLRFSQLHFSHVELVKCDFFPSAIWYKMYF